MSRRPAPSYGAARRLGTELPLDNHVTTFHEIRQTIFSLRSTEEKDNSLRHEVLGILQEAAEVLGFEPSVRFDGPVDTAVPATAATQVSAVLREALTNIGRHAAASSAHVDLAVTGTAVRLTSRFADVGRPSRPAASTRHKFT